MRRGWALAVGMLVASCGSSATAPRAPPLPVVPAGPPPIAVAPPPISIPPAPTAPRDQCGAWELQGLVGRPRTEIPVPVQPNLRRVVCSTCPRTFDYRPNRMTIEYDAESNRVTSVTCG